MKAKQLLKVILAIGIFALVVACGDDEPVNTSILNPEQASQKALTMVAGTVTSSTMDSLNNEWDVKITTSTGALVKVELVNGTGVIDKIEGTEGPFNYEVKPGSGLVNFSVAKAAAIAAMTGITDNITFWELKHDNGGVYTYEFLFLDANSQETKVKVDAVNGHVIQ